MESVWAVALEALGQPRDRVAVAHPDRLLAVDAGEQRVVGGDADVGRAVLAVVERDDVAAELVGHQLGAVADAEDGDPAGPDGRIRPRGARVVDRVRAARQDDRARAAALELVEGRVERQQLRVDVELAHAAGDELGELAAEVEDDDGARGGGRRAGRVGRRDERSGERRLERGLEIGLDLGVVRGEDAVAGVGGLTVDGLAALLRRRVLVAQRSSSRRSVRLGCPVGSCPPRPDRRQCTGPTGAGTGRLSRGCASPRAAIAK